MEDYAVKYTVEMFNQLNRNGYVILRREIKQVFLYDISLHKL